MPESPVTVTRHGVQALQSHTGGSGKPKFASRCADLGTAATSTALSAEIEVRIDAAQERCCRCTCMTARQRDHQIR